MQNESLTENGGQYNNLYVCMKDSNGRLIVHGKDVFYSLTHLSTHELMIRGTLCNIDIMRLLRLESLYAVKKHERDVRVVRLTKACYTPFTTSSSRHIC